ncbi:hypothetical protein OsI_13787 [Oryza sativa Indica Group]|uniref:Uncharacterized protein n=1 Tax=Oryza sativa subsp. indica TaxID=39946 RepID=B8AKX0_ORYSI|nr:hypothetical protein OsI_13787 [Oryza sativa Indica Group]
MEAVQPPMLSDRLNPLIHHRSAFPASVVQPQDHGDSVPGLCSGSFIDTRGRLSSGSMTSEDSPALTPRWLSIKSNSSSDNCFEGSKRAVSWSDRHVFNPNGQVNYAEFMDLMKQELDTQLDRLKGDVTGLENFALPDNGYIIGTHLGMSLDVMLIEIDERFNALKLLLATVFRKAREMDSSSVSDLQWEHELQLEVINITIGEFISGLQEEMERKLYEQISMTNSMSKNWQDAIAQFASMRDDLGVAVGAVGESGSRCLDRLCRGWVLEVFVGFVTGAAIARRDFGLVYGERSEAHLRGLLADNMKDVKELSSQLSEASKEMSIQLSSEDDLLRQIAKIKEEYEDLQIEAGVRDGVYQTVTRKLLDDSMNSMHDAATNFSTELSSLEAMISEKEKALCLSNEENRMLKEKIAELEQCLIQDKQEDPEVIKQESTEIILRDIEVAPHISPRRSHKTPKQDMQYDELVKLNSSLEIASAALKEVENKNIDYNGIFTKNEQEKQLECILISIMKLSKEFVEIEQKLSVERSASRSEDLSDHCNHMVRQAVVLTKIGLWYKQMLETRRSELQKAEAKVVILGDKVNSHLNLLQKIYVTLDRYSPTLQQYPGLLDAFLKTCKLVAGMLKSRLMRTYCQEGTTDTLISWLIRSCA